MPYNGIFKVLVNMLKLSSWTLFTEKKGSYLVDFHLTWWAGKVTKMP